MKQKQEPMGYFWFFPFLLCEYRLLSQHIAYVILKFRSVKEPEKGFDSWFLLVEMSLFIGFTFEPDKGQFGLISKTMFNMKQTNQGRNYSL